MNIIKRLNRIIFKIKDYDRLEYDYRRILDHDREFIKEQISNSLSHQWISIKDKLPDKNTWCIIGWGSKAKALSLYIDCGHFLGDETGMTEFWMPIPKIDLQGKNDK